VYCINYSCAKSQILLPPCRKVAACHSLGTPQVSLGLRFFYIPSIQSHYKKTHVSQQYNILWLCMLAARATRCHETTEQLVYDDLFLFLRDTSRGLSRIFPRNKPPAGRHVLRYTPVAAPVSATPVTLQTLRIPQ
jgi:hypothetical protein